MPGPFDATLKQLVATYPRDWLAQLGLPATGPIEVLDTDLSTVSPLADKVLRVAEPSPWILHVEFMAGRDTGFLERCLGYNVLLATHYRQPVLSVVVLLRREASDRRLTGVLRIQPPVGGGSLEFRYRVVRLWRLPVETILMGGVGTLPLAPLCEVSRKELPELIRQMEERLPAEMPPSEVGTFWTSTYLLLGLKYPSEFAERLLQGVRGMKESSTYQAILAEGEARGRAEGEAVGRAEEARKVLLLLGGKQLGAPDAATRATVQAATLDRLETWTARLLDVRSWQELLGSVDTA